MKILIVEDDSVQREVLRSLLEARFQQQAKLREADNLKTAFMYLDRADVDCVVLDLQLPDSDGRETFFALHEAHPEIPIVVMTNNLDRDLALAMIKGGAADYLIKNFTNDEEIYRRILFAIERQRRGERVPYEKLREASRDRSTRRNPDAVTQRPHALSTIHVPEIGPRQTPPLLSVARPLKEATPAQAPPEEPIAPPVEVSIETKLEELSWRVNKVLTLLTLLLLAMVAALFWSRRAHP